jgi:hypothetical protein
MIRPVLLLSCLALSFGALAATPPKPAPAPATKPASAARPASAPASAPAVQHDAVNTRSQLAAAKGRGSLMSACQKKAADQDLQQVDRQQFLAACMAGK